jgi:hypothetical protein
LWYILIRRKGEPMPDNFEALQRACRYRGDMGEIKCCWYIHGFYSGPCEAENCAVLKREQVSTSNEQEATDGIL